MLDTILLAPLPRSHELGQLPDQPLFALLSLCERLAAARSAGLCVRRRQVTVTADAAGTKLGIRLEPCPSAPSEIVQVKDVIDGGCAASQGVEVGMELSDVNGVAVKGWGIESIEETLR